MLSVIDHKRPHAFVAELGLFDALVVPVPPSGADAQAWSAENWNGALQAELLDAIPDHKLRRVPWDATQRGRWAQRREAALATLDVGMIREQRRQAVAAGRSAYMAECVWAERPTAAGMGCPRRARPRGLRRGSCQQARWPKTTKSTARSGREDPPASGRSRSRTRQLPGSIRPSPTRIGGKPSAW